MPIETPPAGRLAFCCADCGSVLAEGLVPMLESALCLDIEAQAVPSGRVAQVTAPWTYREFVTGRAAGRHYTSADGDLVVFEAGDWLLHVGDVRHVVMPGASFGCCGLQPRDEVNVTCEHGHPIGTVHADCWASTLCRLRARHVVAIEG